MVDRSPKSLFPEYAPTIPNVLAAAVAGFPDDEFLVSGRDRITFRQADERAAALARGLVALGVGKGTRVGILMPNSPDWVLCWLAAARIGALTVPISTFYQGRELARVLDHADVDTLLMADAFLKHDYVARLEEIAPLRGQRSSHLSVAALPYLRHVVVWGPSRPEWGMAGPDDLVALGASDPAFDAGIVTAMEERVAPSDDLVIIYTSGSTSEPKAVVHTHATVVRLCHALIASGWADVVHGDRIYGAAPFFWIGGPNSTIMPALFTGSCVVTSDTPAIDDVVDTCARERVTSINAWTPQLRAIEQRAAERGVTFPHLRSRLRQIDEHGELIPPHLIPNPFGMTETFGPHGLEPNGTRLPSDKLGAFARTLAGMERKVVDPETGNECPPGVAGELYVRGFSLMRGFYKRLPEETFDEDGFYPTGDRCRIDDDGFMYFEGRFGEMIKTSGANVAPREVELALERLEEVREAAVLGVPDPRRGELVVAVVVAANGAPIDAEHMAKELRQEVSHFKVPQRIFEMDYDDIPRTDSGKVKKHLLRELLLEHWEKGQQVGAD